MTVITDAFVDACGLRMFELHEIARTMVMHEHPRGGGYQVRGNKRERMAKYGNAVTPPASQLTLSRLADVQTQRTNPTLALVEIPEAH